MPPSITFASVICEICGISPRGTMNLAPVKGSAPKGQESLAQVSPWVSQNKLSALKGLETRTRSGSKVRYPVAPSGLIRLGGITQGKPGLCFFGRFGPRIGNIQTRSSRMTPNTYPKDFGAVVFFTNTGTDTDNLVWQ